MPPTLTSRRVAKYAAGTLLVGAVAVLLPPKETLPAPLLPARVLADGMGRAARCVYVGAQIYADYTYSLRGDEARNSQAAWDEVHARCAQRLVRLAERNGGLYVKSGQIFANMSHILPVQYCRIMAALQNDVAPRPFSEIVAVLERDLHAPWTDVFASLDPQPIAAASLAQVHRGRLRDGDVDVAVKVQYLDMMHRLSGDVHTIDVLLRVAGYIYPGFDFGQIVQKLNETIAAELDFRIEARNSERAARELRAGGFGDRVVCAQVCHPYVTERVLVSRFVDDAVKIGDYAGLRARGLRPREVASLFFDAMSYQIFTTGFFHADPHAGNVLVRRLPNGRPQVVLLDYGLCAQLTHEQRRNLAAIWTAAVVHDSAALQRLAVQYNCADDYELFASCFLQHPYVYHSTHNRVLDADTRESMRTMMRNEMTRVNRIVAAMPKEYALVLRSCIAMKAINRELCDAANRHLRMLRYSLRATSASMSRLRMYSLFARAWLMEWYSTLVLAIVRWTHPEVDEMLDGALQVCG